MTQGNSHDEPSAIPTLTPVLTPVSRPLPPAALDALTDALAAERQLIDELIAVMLRQREAVAIDDLQAVDDSVFATHRLLLTLGEARKRRRSINRMLGCQEELVVRQLGDVLGNQMTPRLRAERDKLQAAARHLSKEIETNRRILREALANSENLVRAMRGVPIEKTPGYGAVGVASYATPGTTSFTRTA